MDQISYSRATGRLGGRAVFAPFEKLISGLTPHDEKTAGALKRYPAGITFVYRAADSRGTCSYARMNPCIYLFLEERLTPDRAAERLRELGLTALADRERGNLVLMTPVGRQFGPADVDLFLHLGDGALNGLMDVYGSFACSYAVGIGGGADFLSKELSTAPQAASRLAAALLIGGTGSDGSDVYPRKIPLTPLPAYLSGCDAEVVSWFQKLCGVSEPHPDGEVSVAVSEKNPALRVITAYSGRTEREIIEDAYDRLFRRTLRASISPGRSAFLDGCCWAPDCRVLPEEEGIHVVAHENGTRLKGTGLCRWYEYVPREFLGTTEKNVPLILLLHGNRDDPAALMEQCGFLKLAARQRIAIVAPDHQMLDDVTKDSLGRDNNKLRMFGGLLDEMLRKYPFLDPGRVYVTGFSRGAMNACALALLMPERFAAAAIFSGLRLFPMDAPDNGISMEDFRDYRLKTAGKVICRLPTLIFQCERDFFFSDRVGLRAVLRLHDERGIPRDGDTAQCLSMFRQLNGYPQMTGSHGTFDPFWGFSLENVQYFDTPDVRIRLGAEKNRDGRADLRFAVGEGMEHSLYGAYAPLCWALFRNARRNPVTLESELSEDERYTPD